MVSGNIFDSPNGVFYNWIYANDSQSGHLISGNTYYQHQTTSGTVPVWCFGQGHLNDPGMVQYASDQEDLKRLISLWDSSATVYLIS